VPLGNDQQEGVARRWFTEGWAGEVGLADVIFDPTFMGNGVELGPMGPRRHVLSRLAGFPDLETDIEDVICAGDHVTIRLQWSGTHRGPYAGVPATGRHVSLDVMVLWRFRDGKVVEDWTIQDWLSYLYQVGAIPSDQFRDGPEPQP
jgi:predicted ester cyclase